MRKLFLVSAIVGSVWLIADGCYYDKADLLYPPGSGTTCDTTAVATFSGSVVPVLNAQCTSCHSGSFPSAGISLDTYAGVKTVANNGSLTGSINHSTGYVPMPQGSAKMNACDILVIQRWINSGMLNN